MTTRSPLPASAHAQGFQTVGQAIHLLGQSRVGIDLLGAILAQPDEGGLVAAFGGEVP